MERYEFAAMGRSNAKTFKEYAPNGILAVDELLAEEVDAIGISSPFELLE